MTGVARVVDHRVIFLGRLRCIPCLGLWRGLGQGGVVCAVSWSAQRCSWHLHWFGGAL